ncbi:MAG: formylglycine-generating enzyme family protein [Candidatus Cloacimonetes bacterium]|nr:formylglycine-generating enzyme family protein [Candidatus Cloacimonadota bacterium]
MKYRAIIVTMFIFVASYICAYPLVYDARYTPQGDSIVCEYKASNIPSGATIQLDIAQSDGTLLSIGRKAVEGDIHDLVRDSLVVSAIAFSSDAAFLKVIVDGIEYGEMVHIPAGRYSIRVADELIEQFSIKDFFLSKREISNEQYRQFILADGYDTESVWIIAKGLMKDVRIGWHYQGMKHLSKPIEWNFGNEPWFAGTTFDKGYESVGGVTWFEANAYCNWIGAFLPTYAQLVSCFPGDSFASSRQREKTSLVMGVADCVAEWTLVGIDPQSISCGGCNEMKLLENNQMNLSSFPLSSYRCPLFRNEYLGFRIAVPYSN